MIDPVRARVAALLRDRVNRNAAALALNALVSSALGLGYWLVAARGYDAATVGVNAALISSMMLVAGASDIGLKNGLVRFSAVAGRSFRRLVLGSYAFGAIVSGLIGVVVVVAFPSAISDPDRLSTWSSVLFVAAAMAWTVFVLQDSVLTGVGRSSWVLAENTVYGVAKLGLLVGFAASGAGLGIFASWTLPVLALVVIVNVGLFRVIRPTDEPSTVTLRQLSRYAGSDFVASSLWKAATRGMPLAVIVLVGEEETAYYHVAWSIAYVLYLLVSSVSEAVVADGAAGGPDPRRVRRALLLDVGLVVPAAAVTAIGAPLILAPFGGGYADATTTLRLLAASAVPYAVSGSILAVARIEERLRTIVVAYASLTVLLAIGTLVLAPTTGIVGIGVAWLAAQSVVAAGLVTTRPELSSALLRFGPFSRLHAIVERRRGRPSRDALRALDHAVPSARRRRIWSLETDGVLVTALSGAEAGSPPTVVRLATNEQGAAAVLANADGLRSLRAAPELTGWCEVAPTLVGAGPGRDVVTEESLMPGHTGAALAAAGADLTELRRSALATISTLHQVTARQRLVDDAILDDLVHRPLDLIAHALPGRHRHAGIDAIRSRLVTELGDRVVRTSWIHGDFWLSNVLFDDGLAVTGIVDWERSRPGGLPEHDTMALALTTTAMARRREFGAVVIDALSGAGPTPEPAANADLDRRALVLSVWVDHVSGLLRRSPGASTRSVWVATNVDAVLASVGELAIR